MSGIGRLGSGEDGTAGRFDTCIEKRIYLIRGRQVMLDEVVERHDDGSLLRALRQWTRRSRRRPSTAMSAGTLWGAYLRR
jgi:hypothetical protein